MTENQQRLYCALALLDECDLKAFFRAIRYHEDSTHEVELVNVELDHGVALMDIFGPLGPLHDHLAHHTLDLKATFLRSGRWAIDFGFHGRTGHGTCWTMNIGEGAVISGLVSERVWMPSRRVKKPWSAFRWIRAAV